MDRIPVLLCLDLEPDHHVYPLSEPSAWSGAVRLVVAPRNCEARWSWRLGRP